MSKLLGHSMIRCSRWAHLPRLPAGALFSTTSIRCDDLWGKMATGQELQANAKASKVYKNKAEEKEEILKRIQQLKNTVRESEQKLTGLQRMKYKEEEYDKDAAFEQMRHMRSQTKHQDVVIEPEVTHTVQDIRRDPKFRFAQSFANLVASGGLFMVCYFMWKSLNKKVAERQGLQEGALAVGAVTGSQDSNAATESKNVTKSEEIPVKKDTVSIFD